MLAVCHHPASGDETMREVRDAMGSRIYSGTSEIQRVLIASMLGL